MDTGYEAKFDYQPRDYPPTRTYLLAATPRSGSTYFSHVLWRTGCLGAPLEYLNFDPSGPYGFASDSRHEQARLWRLALRTRTSPNGVFGLKGFPMQFEALNQRNLALLRDVLRTVLPHRANKGASFTYNVVTAPRTPYPMHGPSSLAFGARSRKQTEARSRAIRRWRWSAPRD